MGDQIIAEALSRFGSVRVTIGLDEGTIVVERWHLPGSLVETTGTLSAAEVESLRVLAAAVRQDEQALVRGDFYRDGKKRLRLRLGDRRIEIHNDSDRIDTPAAGPLLRRCYELADRAAPWR